MSDTVDFEVVRQQELKDIVERRKANKANKLDRLVIEQTVEQELVGLALSGGGVRSGATSLGLLDAMHHSKLMEDVDYLSTVSGGSYAGAFLSSDSVSNERNFCRLNHGDTPAPFGSNQNKTPKRILDFVFSTRYMRDTFGFLNRQIFGMLLVLTVVISGLATVSALVAWLVRLIDYPEARAVVRSLGFGSSEISLAMVPAFIAFSLWMMMWGLAYLRRVNHRTRTAARYSFFIFIFFLMVGVASLMSTGDLWLGDKSAVPSTSLLSKTSAFIVAAISASLLPYLSPKSLIKSGTKPSNSIQRYSFWLATNGLLFGLPFLFIGFMLQENISGVNDYRSGKIVASSEIKGWLADSTVNPFWTNVLKNSCVCSDCSPNHSKEETIVKDAPELTKRKATFFSRIYRDIGAGVFNQSQNENAANSKHESKDSSPKFCSNVYCVNNGKYRFNDPYVKSDNLETTLRTFTDTFSSSDDLQRILRPVAIAYDGHSMETSQYKSRIQIADRAASELAQRVDSKNLELKEVFKLLGGVNWRQRDFKKKQHLNVWSSITTLFSNRSMFWERFEVREDYRKTKDMLADWVGYQMSFPDFYKKLGIDEESDDAKQIILELDQISEQFVLSNSTQQSPDLNDIEFRSEIEDLNRAILLAVYPNDFQPQSTIKSYVCLANDQATRLWICLYSFIVFLVSGCLVNLNATSCHSFYRNRLSEMWIEKGAGLDAIPLPQLETTKHGYPYHLILGSLAYVGKFDPQLGKERIDHFLFSRLFCGSQRTGFVRADKYMNGKVTLDDAVAISGAAISVVHIKNALIMFLLFITNLRLGQWLENPRLSGWWQKSRMQDFWRFFCVTPIGMLMHVGKYADNRPNLFVADGGHFENLAIDELVRRKCRLIIALDAGADPEFKMEDLVRFLRWSRMNHGVTLTPITNGDDLTDAEFVSQLGAPLDKAEKGDFNSRYSKTNYLIWKIQYNNTELTEHPESEFTPTMSSSTASSGPQTGILIFIKNTLTGDEPLELVKYHADHLEFPHDSTSDQFFDPSKFESYRLLGSHLGASVCKDIRRRVLKNEFDEETMDCLELARCFVPDQNDASRSDEYERQLGEIVDRLFSRLKSESTVGSRRRNIVDTLQGLTCGKTTIPILLEYANEDDTDVRHLASNMLESGDGIAHVIDLIQQESDDSIKLKALRYVLDLFARDFFDDEQAIEVAAKFNSHRKLLTENKFDLEEFDFLCKKKSWLKKPQISSQTKRKPKP